MAKPLGTQWAVRTYGSASIGGGVVEGLAKGGRLYNLLASPPNVRALAQAGFTGKVMMFEVMDRQSGHTAVCLFAGVGYGVGFGSASADHSGWTTFETENAQSPEDFAVAARVWGASAGIGAGTGIGGIVFHNIDIKHEGLFDEMFWGDSVSIGGFFFGAGAAISESAGKVFLLHLQPYADADSTDLVVRDDLDNPERESGPLDMGVEIPDSGATARGTSTSGPAMALGIQTTEPGVSQGNRDFESATPPSFDPGGSHRSPNFESSTQPGFDPGVSQENRDFESATPPGFDPGGSHESPNFESATPPGFDPGVSQENRDFESAIPPGFDPGGSHGSSNFESATPLGFDPGGSHGSPNFEATPTGFDPGGGRGSSNFESATPLGFDPGGSHGSPNFESVTPPDFDPGGNQGIPNFDSVPAPGFNPARR